MTTLAIGSRSTAQSGFTLFELLIVLAVMGLALAVFAGAGRPPSDLAQARTAAAEVASALKRARAIALRVNRSVAVEFDLGRGVLRAPEAPILTLPPRVRLSLLTATDEVVDGSTGRIRFSGDGSATGGRVGLTAGTVTAWIGVDWLTGKVAMLETR